MGLGWWRWWLNGRRVADWWGFLGLFIALIPLISLIFLLKVLLLILSLLLLLRG